MKKIYLLLILVSILAINAKAQVTIGKQENPDPQAVLDLKSDSLGLLPPRVRLVAINNYAPLKAHVEGMVVYNTHVTDTLRRGLYYNDGSKWINLSPAPFTKQNWFYMPSIIFDTSTNNTGLTKDLYQEFKKQLNTTGGHVIFSAGGAPNRVLTSIPAANDLYYYVTDYDPLVFDNISIDVNGLMRYNIIGQASDSTILNIVFVEK
jgi:hypothetical protein